VWAAIKQNVRAAITRTPDAQSLDEGHAVDHHGVLEVVEDLAMGPSVVPEKRDRNSPDMEGENIFVRLLVNCMVGRSSYDHVCVSQEHQKNAV
jgi:hypothetical protein